jgi:hypothetical protein
MPTHRMLLYHSHMYIHLPCDGDPDIARNTREICLYSVVCSVVDVSYIVVWSAVRSVVVVSDIVVCFVVMRSSQSSTHHYEVRTKTGWFRVKITFPWVERYAYPPHVVISVSYVPPSVVRWRATQFLSQRSESCQPSRHGGKLDVKTNYKLLLYCIHQQTRCIVFYNSIISYLNSIITKH